MPKYLARWTRTQATDLEFEADDDDLAYDHATHVQYNSEYLTKGAEWSDGEVELQDVEPVDDTDEQLYKLFEWVIEQASRGQADAPERYVANVDAILHGVTLEYEEDEN
jgi:hypothetical protein